MLTYRTATLLLQPTRRQDAALRELLVQQRNLYNAALEERRGAWRWEGRSVSRRDQFDALTGWDFTSRFGVAVCRGTLLRLDRAFAAFFRRVRAGEKPGFPRFKSEQRFDSLEWPYRDCWTLQVDRRRLRIVGIGHVKFRSGRIVGTPKTLIVRREGKRWRAFIVCEAEQPAALPKTGRVVGIDRGVAVAAAGSDGWIAPNPRYGRLGAERLTRAQQNLQSKQIGSKRRRKAVDRVVAAHRKVAHQRSDFCHKLSRRLVDEYDLIALEDLKIANMVRSAAGTIEEPGTNVAAKSGLNRSILDAGWGTLHRHLAYKAEEAGRELILVDPRHTSQRCAECGHVAKENRVTQAVFRCQSCGHSANADTNAARNILWLGLSQRSKGVERPSGARPMEDAMSKSEKGAS